MKYCWKCGQTIYFDLIYPAHVKHCIGKTVTPNMNFEDTPIQQEINNNPVLKDVQALFEAQTAKGLDKYGNTVNIDEYNLSEWIDHVLQEKMDEIVYLMTIKHKIKKVIG